MRYILEGIVVHTSQRNIQNSTYGSLKFRLILICQRLVNNTIQESGRNLQLRPTTIVKGSLLNLLAKDSELAMCKFEIAKIGLICETFN